MVMKLWQSLCLLPADSVCAVRGAKQVRKQARNHKRGRPALLFFGLVFGLFPVFCIACVLGSGAALRQHHFYELANFCSCLEGDGCFQYQSFELAAVDGAVGGTLILLHHIVEFHQHVLHHVPASANVGALNGGSVVVHFIPASTGIEIAKTVEALQGSLRKLLVVAAANALHGLIDTKHFESLKLGKEVEHVAVHFGLVGTGTPAAGAEVGVGGVGRSVVGIKNLHHIVVTGSGTVAVPQGGAAVSFTHVVAREGGTQPQIFGDLTVVTQFPGKYEVFAQVAAPAVIHATVIEAHIGQEAAVAEKNFHTGVVGVGIHDPVAHKGVVGHRRIVAAEVVCIAVVGHHNPGLNGQVVHNAIGSRQKGQVVYGQITPFNPGLVVVARR